jgi:uncharacterized membrane protein
LASTRSIDYIVTMNPNFVLLVVGGLCIGIVAGMRALTAPAVTSWAVRVGWLDLTGFHFARFGTTVTAVVLSVLALIELINDKRPNIPARTAPLGFGARLFTGTLSAIVIFASAHQSLIVGALLGAIGAVIGTFGGYHLRRYLTQTMRIPDLYVALAEDFVAVGGGLLLVSHLF